MSDKKKYDSTVARIAGNIAPQAMKHHDWSDGDDAYLRLAIHVVKLARAIVRETEQTEPKGSEGRDADVE